MRKAKAFGGRAGKGAIALASMIIAWSCSSTPAPNRTQPEAAGCPTSYDLPHYTGDTSGLCNAGESMLVQSTLPGCGCQDVAAVVGPECTPDGTMCFVSGGYCEPNGACGWAGAPASAALGDALDPAKPGPSHATPCASDRDCTAGHYCTLRVANRMFCDDSVLARASDYCTDAGLEAGDAASEAGGG